MSTGSWEYIGGRPGGTVGGLAVSPDFVRDRTIFAATMVGLYRSQDQGVSWRQVAGRLPGPFLSAVAVSPDFAHDGMVLVASLEGAVYHSTDRGGTWMSGRIRQPGDIKGRPNISALVISPDFTRDGVAFAGSLGDGVFRSRDRCATWEPCNFGLLDLTVLDLAISPAFSQDETVFAATTTGLFRSNNGGRAWRELDFPFDAVPVQCLACSPSFVADGTLFAGTEAAGLFRSTDWGKTWQLLRDWPETLKCVNALALSPAFAEDGTTLAATDSEVYVSRAAGEGWSRCGVLPEVLLCLTLAPNFSSRGPALVGLSKAGVYRSSKDLASWEPANEGLSGRVLAGLALSPAFASDRRAFAFGPEEGVIRSVDGGLTWTDASTDLPSLHVDDLAITPAPNGETHLFAAVSQGVWKSRQWGETWEQLSDLPARKLGLSPLFSQDSSLVAGTTDQDLWVSYNAGESWQPVDVPWNGKAILALALSPAFARDGKMFVIVDRTNKVGAEVWQGGTREPWVRVIHHQGAARSAALSVPPTYPLDGRWYAAVDDQFYRPSGGVMTAKQGRRHPVFSGRPLALERPTIINLAVLPRPQASHLLAATDRGVYLSTNRGAEWDPLNDGLPARPTVAVLPSPDFAQDRAVYALELSGNLWRLVYPHER